MLDKEQKEFIEDVFCELDDIGKGEPTLKFTNTFITYTIDITGDVPHEQMNESIESVLHKVRTRLNVFNPQVTTLDSVLSIKFKYVVKD